MPETNPHSKRWGVTLDDITFSLIEKELGLYATGGIEDISQPKRVGRI
jgi:hypothetical protein